MVNVGNLALSRALGDFEFKQNANLDAEHQVVTADPDITVHEPTPEDEFLVIACDGSSICHSAASTFLVPRILPRILTCEHACYPGIWDVLSSQQVIDYVRRELGQRKEIVTICEELMDRCLAPDSDWGGVGCDNMTVMIIAIRGTRSKDEWADWMVERVEKGVGYATPKEFVDPFEQGPRGALAGAGGKAGVAIAGGAQESESDEDEDESPSTSVREANSSPFSLLHLLTLCSQISAMRTIQEALRAQGITIQGFGDAGDDSMEEGEEDGEGTNSAKIVEVSDAATPSSS